MKATNVLETCLYVDDLKRAERVYVDVLGLQFASRQEGRQVFLRCGPRMVLLFNPLGSRDTSDQVPAHGSFGPGHVAFGIREAEVTAWGQWLGEHGVAIERTIDWPEGGRSLYFRDPAGNSLELATPRIWGIEERTLD